MASILYCDGMKSEEITTKLRQLLRDSDKSRYRIAQETQLSQAMLSRFLNDEDRGISLQAAAVLAEYFGQELTLRKRKR